ncbi:hypothetical protein BPBIEBS31_94 [Mycobacterium phage BPBiebs31]|uniref:Uncharacterized protein n=1 Tax=Mycobacterium phage BPBiebs31 TaxID=2902900 RepID=G1DA47_9CAUD|nr:hypothetical protein FGG18_gp08 [Mycobacterium phage BPBiebs31]AEJ91941.1 hypothetical protein BPBIEBS31_94 [Mycobacterium phage BPBiebs31]
MPLPPDLRRYPMNTYPNTSTRSLIEMNIQYLREYRANPTVANLAAVRSTDAELTRRGA